MEKSNNSSFIFLLNFNIYILQYLLSYFIIDQIEQEKISKIIRDYQEKPISTIHGSINIVENYIEEKNFEEKDKENDIDFILIKNKKNKNKEN